MTFDEWFKKRGVWPTPTYKEIWGAATEACADRLETEAARLAETADACCDLSGRIEIKAEQAAMLSAVIILRSNARNHGPA